jgi:hypothetical protein
LGGSAGGGPQVERPTAIGLTHIGVLLRTKVSPDQARRSVVAIASDGGRGIGWHGVADALAPGAVGQALELEMLLGIDQRLQSGQLERREWAMPGVIEGPYAGDKLLVGGRETRIGDAMIAAVASGDGGGPAVPGNDAELVGVFRAGGGLRRIRGLWSGDGESLIASPGLLGLKDCSRLGRCLELGGRGFMRIRNAEIGAIANDNGASIADDAAVVLFALADEIRGGLGGGAEAQRLRQRIRCVAPDTDVAMVLSAFMVWLLTVSDGARRHATDDTLGVLDHLAALHERALGGFWVRAEEWHRAGWKAQKLMRSSRQDSAGFEVLLIARAAAERGCWSIGSAAAAWAEAQAKGAEPKIVWRPHDLERAYREHLRAYQRMGEKLVRLVEIAEEMAKGASPVI